MSPASSARTIWATRTSSCRPSHGFDEFFGNLYHLNAEEEPENPDYPKNPEFKKRFGPRGVMHCWATDKDDPTEDPVFGRVGKQRIENTGPLTTKRMETVNDEFTDAALDFIDKAHKDEQAVLRLGELDPHAHLHAPEAVVHREDRAWARTQTAWSSTTATSAGCWRSSTSWASPTTRIVMYSTDNGPEEFSWPDGGTSPFRGEKDTNWEAGWRVPTLLRWPGVIKPGTVSNEIFAHEDMLPTILAAAGVPDVKEKLLKGYKVGDKTFKVHLDGYNLLPFLKGEVKESPRKEMLYWSDDGDLMALRYGNWKAVFKEQRAESFAVWSEPMVDLRVPKLFNLRSDPFEKADKNSIYYNDWLLRRVFLLVPAQGFVAHWIQSFKDFPPSQKPASFSIDQVMEKLTASGQKNH